MTEGAERPPRPPRPPWSAFKEALDAAGFRPSRRLGQNFLLDENLARAIARDAAVGAGDFVLEVGPGCGFLSVHLLDQGARLLAVEVDERLADVSETFLAPYPDVELLRTDVLAGKHALSAVVEERLPAEGDWHVVSNLPYSISGPVLAILAGRANPPASMTALVQLEVAERLAASPGTSDWGPLTIAVQTVYDVSLVRTVPPGLFWPRPKVQSGVVRMERRAAATPPGERRRLLELVAALFQRRRQTLGRVLGDALGRPAAGAALATVGIDPRRRAETLELEELRALAVAVDSVR